MNRPKKYIKRPRSFMCKESVDNVEAIGYCRDNSNSGVEELGENFQTMCVEPASTHKEIVVDDIQSHWVVKYSEETHMNFFFDIHAKRHSI